MAPKLRVMAGTSPGAMVPITSLVNTNKPHRVSSDLFDGEIVAHIKNFPGEGRNIRESEYFAKDDRQGVTWSIQVRGRFLRPYSADDILFGNTFDRPLKLPWGIGAVLKFMNYIDPSLEHDIQSNTKPWALSPLVSTMPHLIHRQISTNSPSASGESLIIDDTLPFPSTEPIIDSTPDLYKTVHNYHSKHSSSTSNSSSGSSAYSSSTSLSSTSATTNLTKSETIKSAMKKVGKRKKTPQSLSDAMHFENAAARRGYFSHEANRQAVVFGPLDVITTDFCYGFIEFSPSLSLRLPGGLSFDLMRYWDGQPVRFVCCERKEASSGIERDDGNPWGRTFWCVTIEAYDDDD